MNSNKEIQINGGDGQVYEFHEDVYESHEDFLGRGVFGRVVKGKNISNQNDVAVKIVSLVDKRNLSDRQKMLEREIENLEVLTNTKNENIVSLFAVKIIAKNAFMVIEYCNYKDFGQYLKAKVVLSEDEIKYFFKQVANGLKALHEKKIIHRDLKPENLMLSNPTGLSNPPFYELIVKISDFGLSRVLPEGSLSITGGRGTHYYMAPEVFLDQKYDSKADIWSLGMIIYECLTNSLPLEKEGIRDIGDLGKLIHLYETKAKFNLEMPENVTKGLSDIIIKSLEQNIPERISLEHFISNPFFTDISKSYELIKNIKCLKKKNELKINFLFEHGADIEHQNSKLTYLMDASHKNKIEIVRYLLEFGADLNEKNNALFYAAGNENDNKLIVELLLEHGADIEHQNTEGETCLMTASIKNRIEIVRYLLEKGADLNRKDKYDRTALHYAARNENDNKLIVKLLLEHGADIEHQNTEGETCLMTASIKNRIEIVRYLLEKGADLNRKDKYDRTALHYAARNENDNKLIVKLLLEHGADIEHQSIVGVTCLMHASYKNKIEIIHYLLEKGADLNRKDKDGSTALHYAAQNENDNKLIVKLLLEHGADIEHPNTYGVTCLMDAAYKNNIEIVRYLLEKGADLNRKDMNSSTALHYASENDNKNDKKLIVKLLLEHQNTEGFSKNSKQSQNWHDKIAEYFSDIIKPSLFIPHHDQKEYNINPDEDFQLQEHIADTSTCSVNLYLHKQSDIKMAIKSIKIPIQRKHGLDEKNLKNLKREIELLTALRNNSNITTFYGAYIKGYELNVCMEYMDMSLEDYYKNVHKIQNYFPELLVGIISVNLIIGLSACKADNKVIHRDIKPRNILVNRSGQIKLCDFGWARILNDSLASTFGGTLAYMPPERFLNKNPNKFDIRNDVWSLGISLIEIIYGRQPFEKRVNVDNSLFEKILQKYSSKTKQFILGCLTKIDERPKYENLKAMEFFNYYVKFKDPEIASMILKACEETPIDNLPISVFKNIASKVFGQYEKMVEIYKLFVNESEKTQ